MKILIVGSGGVGGYLGAVLHRNGHDVTFIARGKHLEAIRTGGLQIESVASGNFIICPTVLKKADASCEADLILFCVKGYDNPGAVEAMSSAVGEGTTIITLQNGIGSGDELAGAFGCQKVLVGAAYIGVAVKMPGTVVELGGEIRIVSGESDGLETPRVQKIRDAMVDVGVDFVVSPRVDVDIWSKFLFICALSGMMCITGGTLVEVLDTMETSILTRRVLSEGEEVARAKDIGLPVDVVGDLMLSLEDGKQTSMSSMQDDLKNGKPLELDVLNGAIVRMGKELGVETPINEFITSCLTPVHNRAMAQRH